MPNLQDFVSNMSWERAFILSSIATLAIFLAAGLFALFFGKYKSGRLLTPYRLIFTGVFLSSVLILFPMYYYVENIKGRIGQIIFISVQHAIRIFGMDDGYIDLVDLIKVLCAEANLSDGVLNFLKNYVSVLYVLSPIMTFVFALSFFRNLSGYMRFLLPWRTEAHVFPELNDKSLALAKSIAGDKPLRFYNKKCVIFTNVPKSSSKDGVGLSEKAKEIGAICFESNIEKINLALSLFVKKKLKFYLTLEDEEKKLKYTSKIIEKYNKLKDSGNKNVTHERRVEIYLFSHSEQSDLLVRQIDGEIKKRINIFRIDEIRSLIYYNLYKNGKEIFLSADEGGKINIAVVGLGKYGTEMAKALTWYCQMPGYSAEIHCFDLSSRAESKFSAICPDVMNEKYNGKDTVGEVKYKVVIHNSTDALTEDFENKIREIKNLSYVFVALGDDEKNLAVANNTLTALLRKGEKPIVDTVIYDDPTSKILNAKSEGMGAPKIRAIGAFSEFNHKDVLINSELTERGFEVHKKWGNSEEYLDAFRTSEYNQRSSISRAIHEDLRESFGNIPYSNRKDLLKTIREILISTEGEEQKREKIAKVEDKAVKDLLTLVLDKPHTKYKDLSSEEKELLAPIYPLMDAEHKRWNAYLRSEGFCLCENENPDRAEIKLNKLRKLHHNLRTTEELDLDTLAKDI